MHTPAQNQKAWLAGVERVRKIFLRLSPGELADLRSLSKLLMETKVEMQRLVERVDAAGHCAVCGGACCVSGRFHFSRVDLLVYLATEEPLFAPRFGSGMCPYLDGNRCLMAAPYRPFNCITFNCETIEDLMPHEDRLRFYRLEGEVKGVYRRIETAFSDGALYGSLLDLSVDPPLPAPEQGPAPSVQCNE